MFGKSQYAAICITPWFTNTTMYMYYDLKESLDTYYLKTNI